MRVSAIVSEKHAARNNKQVQTWSKIRDIKFTGVKPGLVCGVCIELKNTKSGDLDCISCTFTNNLNNVYLGFENYIYNALYVDEYILSRGWEPTGRLIFRGYFEEGYDPEENDYFFKMVEVL